MKMLRIIFLSVCVSFSLITASAQVNADRLSYLEGELQKMEAQKKGLLQEIEEEKLARLRYDLQQVGLPAVLPGEQVISHSAMSLVYDERHEQAKWVAHIITPDIITGKEGRTNDFRPDSKVVSGTAVEADYFLKYPKGNGEFDYDGFGYDRGHLAPSADFRWSKKALSESYFYSNMSPQVAELNREKWADLEGAIRGYVYRNPSTQLFVCTGPVLRNDLPFIERSVNKVSIPQQFWKVVLDIKNETGIAFLMENKSSDYPLSHFSKSIDEIEKLTGIDFFAGLPEPLEAKVEGRVDTKLWFPELNTGDVEPLPMKSLPLRHYNTVNAIKLIGTGAEVTVCGTVVSTRRSRKGNILINLDKQYPNQIFTLFIRKDDIVNFSYDPEEELKGKVLYVRGKVEKMGSTPCIYLKKEESLSILD